MSEQQQQKVKCLGCGYEINIVPAFTGLYCENYCCGCCPNSKASPCQKEKKFGLPSEVLAQFQAKAGGATNVL